MLCLLSHYILEFFFFKLKSKLELPIKKKIEKKITTQKKV